jgi:hypothetical protein
MNARANQILAARKAEKLSEQTVDVHELKGGEKAWGEEK